MRNGRASQPELARGGDRIASRTSGSVECERATRLDSMTA